jgi:hypothetical protein
VRIFFKALATVAIVATALPAHAKDGKAYGGQCLIMNDAGTKQNSRSCNLSGVSCEGDGHGGDSCTWTSNFQEDNAVIEMKPALKVKPALSGERALQPVAKN